MDAVLRFLKDTRIAFPMQGTLADNVPRAGARVTNDDHVPLHMGP